MDKENVVYVCTYTHTHTMLFNLKKKEILPFVTKWINLEGIILSEISQT